jgi:hypothetical protein
VVSAKKRLSPPASNTTSSELQAETNDKTAIFTSVLDPPFLISSPEMESKYNGPNMTINLGGAALTLDSTESQRRSSDETKGQGTGKQQYEMKILDDAHEMV